MRKSIVIVALCISIMPGNDLCGMRLWNKVRQYKDQLVEYLYREIMLNATKKVPCGYGRYRDKPVYPLYNTKLKLIKLMKNHGRIDLENKAS